MASRAAAASGSAGLDARPALCATTGASLRTAIARGVTGNGGPGATGARSDSTLVGAQVPEAPGVAEAGKGRAAERHGAQGDELLAPGGRC